MARNFDAVELVCDPESPLIQEFYNKLVSFFQETEVEPLETFKQEIRSGKCSLFVIKNLKGEIIDFAYGSLISYAEDKNLLAFRFTGAEVDPLIQPGQGADQRLIEHFQRESSVDALLVEATSKKAGKRWYRVKVEEGNGMQWVYIPSGDSMNFGLSDVPIDYFLPPFEWNSDDGTPCDAQLLLKPQSEYLQLAFKGSSDSISIEELRALLTALWESWYIRPKNEFDNDDAWQKHKAIVMALLNDKILKPLENFPSLDLQIPD
ncbi:hypothetical protein HYV57_03360 [Candidatus Peregrinibacteria bacterium]|nr:hypothetical protein [Candidatus Peregrinibacteria bacterium]